MIRSIGKYFFSSPSSPLCKRGQDLLKMKAVGELIKQPDLPKSELFKKLHSLEIKPLNSSKHRLVFPLENGKKIVFEGTFFSNGTLREFRSYAYGISVLFSNLFV